VSWQDFAGLDLPVSPTHGPTCQDQGRASCFTQDDEGAALAAVHLLVRTFPFAGSDVFGPTIEEQVVGSANGQLARETLDAYREIATASGIRDGAPIPSRGGAVAGYRLDPLSGSDGHRLVHVLIRGVGEAGVSMFTEYEVDLVWLSGDWRLVAPAWGDWRTTARALTRPNPATYTSYDALGSA
jgi:hypothetical protein